jgi:hypothetical protein
VHPVAGDGWPEQLNAENLGLSEKRRFGGETPFRARNVMVLWADCGRPRRSPTRGAIRPKRPLVSLKILHAAKPPLDLETS